MSPLAHDHAHEILQIWLDPVSECVRLTSTGIDLCMYSDPENHVDSGQLFSERLQRLAACVHVMHALAQCDGIYGNEAFWIQAFQSLAPEYTAFHSVVVKTITTIKSTFPHFRIVFGQGNAMLQWECFGIVKQIEWLRSFQRQMLASHALSSEFDVVMNQLRSYWRHEATEAMQFDIKFHAVYKEEETSENYDDGMDSTCIQSSAQHSHLILPLIRQALDESLAIENQRFQVGSVDLGFS